MVRRWFFVFGLLTCLASTSLAQGTSGGDPVNHYARPGYATKTIHVWGAVGSPGVWEVEQDLELIDILSAARMTGLGVNPRGRQQYVILTIYRDEGSGRRQLFRRNLEQILRQSDPLPTVLDGDIITVATKQRVGLQTVASVLGAGASITLLVIRLVQLAV